MKIRVCSICKKSKLITSFYKDKSEPSGHKYHCKKCAKKTKKEWYWDNPKRASAQVVKYGDLRKESWTSIIPKINRCQICNEKVYFNIGKSKNVVHFDHRHEGKEQIKITPNVWLRNNKFSEKTKRIFESCDFGILCFQCNRRLPTKNRMEWLLSVISYVTSGKGKLIID